MFAFFSNCLGVLSYAEFKTLFYQTLSRRVEKSTELFPASQKSYVQCLLKMSSDTDMVLLKSNLKFGYDTLMLWLADLAEGLNAPPAKDYFKKMILSSFEKDRVTVEIALSLFSTAYAQTLLHKGSQVINNHAFAFSPHDVREAMAYANRPKKPVAKEPELLFNMEYFYFNIKTTERHIGHEQQKKMFLTRYFAALNTYQLLLTPKDRANAFKAFA